MRKKLEPSAKPIEQLNLRYIPLPELIKSYWQGNPKRHDIGAIAQSIRKHGFRDPLGWDKHLNGGKGGISEGNGRLEALQLMCEQGQAMPRGIAIDESDRWCIPVLFGVDADSELAAQSFGVDHNNLTLLGAEFSALDLSNLYDTDAYLSTLKALADDDFMPVSVSGDDLDFLLQQLNEPISKKENDRGMGGNPREIDCTCPKCGHEFIKQLS